METNHTPLLLDAEGRKQVRERSQQIADFAMTLKEAIAKATTKESLKEVMTMHDIVCLEMLEYLRITWGLNLVEIE